MKPQDFENEELLMMLQDVLTSAASGHTDNLRCPVCERADLDCAVGDDDWIEVTCPKCGLNFKGLLANPEENYTPRSGKIRETFG
ncbi:MAG: hypothetical protein HY902_12395 [Deltaproteobacteria bacterium]|nr:hypothetical protein [Deltaproteobacteria bacterium]